MASSKLLSVEESGSAAPRRSARELLGEHAARSGDQIVGIVEMAGREDRVEQQAEFERELARVGRAMVARDGLEPDERRGLLLRRVRDDLGRLGVALRGAQEHA